MSDTDSRTYAAAAALARDIPIYRPGTGHIEYGTIEHPDGYDLLLFKVPHGTPLPKATWTVREKAGGGG